jgi:hypothetical protein
LVVGVPAPPLQLVLVPPPALHDDFAGAGLPLAAGSGEAAPPPAALSPPQATSPASIPPAATNARVVFAIFIVFSPDPPERPSSAKVI